MVAWLSHSFSFKKIHTFIELSVITIVIRNSSCPGTNNRNFRKMAVPGANFAGKCVGS